MNPDATPALKPSGIVVNCPIIATVRQQQQQQSKAAGSRGGDDSRCQERSGLGYDCVVRPPGSNVAIHYSLGGSQPPSNPCTAGATTTLDMQPMAGDASSSSSSATSASQAQRFAHFAVESTAPGFVGLSFPQTAGKMWPADAVIGTTTQASMPQVQAYHLTRYGVSPSDQNDGWTQHRGLLSNSQGGGASGSSKVMCFSRALDAPDAAVVKSINPSTGVCLCA